MVLNCIHRNFIILSQSVFHVQNQEYVGELFLFIPILRVFLSSTIVQFGLNDAFPLNYFDCLFIGYYSLCFVTELSPIFNKYSLK